MRQGDKVYLVKYALSGGIEQCKVLALSKQVDVDSLVRLVGHEFGVYKIGSDVFADRGEAIAAAEAMRVKKIASIKKQLAKLEKRDFVAEVIAIEKGGTE